MFVVLSSCSNHKYKPFSKNGLTIEFFKPIKATHKDLAIDNQKLMDIVSKSLEEKRKK